MQSELREIFISGVFWVDQPLQNDVSPPNILFDLSKHLHHQNDVSR
jgi:hypothetical protein